MEEKTNRREEIMKILQLIEDGKIDQDKGMSLIATLEGKKVVGGISGIVKDERSSDKCKSSLGPLGAILGMVIAGGIVFGLIFYLPMNAPAVTVALVYSLIGILALCGTLIVVSGIGIARFALKKKFAKQQEGDDNGGEKKRGISVEVS